MNMEEIKKVLQTKPQAQLEIVQLSFQVFFKLISLSFFKF